MAFEHVRRAALPRSVVAVAGDVVELAKAEFALARVEIADKLSTKLRATIWMALAGLFAVLTLVFLAQAAALALASTGIAVHWALLIVAGGLCVLAIIFVSLGLGGMREDMTPTRTINQIKQDIQSIQENLK